MRLATAQGELAGLLDAKLAREERRAQAIRTQIEQLSISMRGTDANLLTFHGAGLKQLADAETMLAACKTEADKIRSDLLAARGREKVFSAKGGLLRMAEERKSLEEEGREAALCMAAKASGKTVVVR